MTEETTRQCCVYRDKKLIAAEVAVLLGIAWGIMWNYLSMFIVIVAGALLTVAAFRTVRKWVFVVAAIVCGLEGIMYILTMIRVDEVLEEICEEDDGTVDEDGTCKRSFYMGMTVIGLFLSLVQVTLLVAFVKDGYVGEEQVGVGEQQPAREPTEAGQEKTDDQFEQVLFS